MKKFALAVIGIICFTPYSWSQKDATIKEFNKAFILPSFSVGFSFMRGDSPMEVNLKSDVI